MRRWVLAITMLAAIAPLAQAQDGDAPRCFGAASRSGHCHNPALRYMVVPSPPEAKRLHNAPCTAVADVLRVCAFGAPAAGAVRTVALVGDSHAGHWEPAFDHAARLLGWRGLQV